MTSNVQNIYSSVDPILLELSMVDYFVLQRLSIHKIPIVRYQLMKNIRNYLPDVSTAKFYRILEKFEKYGFVDSTTDDDKKTTYSLSSKGTLAIPQIQQLVNQFGYNIFIHFTNEWSKMFELLKGRNKIVGFIDYENLLEIAFIEMYVSQVDKFYLGCESSFYDYVKISFPQVMELAISTNQIREPDNYFDTFVVFLHDDVNSIIDELHRVVKPNGGIIVVEVPKPDQTHFVNRILFEQFAPDHLKKEKTPLNISNALNSKLWKLENNIDIDSLRLIHLIKV